MTQPPAQPKIYHIAHIDRLPSIIADGFLWSDSVVARRSKPGTTIGMSGIKTRRLNSGIRCHPGLHVGDCVPFYFCSRSVMLFLIYQANHPELNDRGGQEPILHLEADLHAAVDWAERQARSVGRLLFPMLALTISRTVATSVSCMRSTGPRSRLGRGRVVAFPR